MKKIALLFTILCAGALNGMEKSSELNPALWGQLPEDIKPLITMALTQSGDNLDSAIKNIIKASRINTTLNQMINEQHGNLQGFTKLVHMLANKFNTSTQEVANMFKTPIAEEYILLSEKLQRAIEIYLEDSERQEINSEEIENSIKELIKHGADINFTFNFGGPPMSLLKYIFAPHYFNNSKEGMERLFPKRNDLLQIFLGYGAIPNETVINWFKVRVSDLNKLGNPSPSTKNEIDEITNMLNKAMKK